jgi:FKBP-type peptidyl-prolyl cis-trans isomerase SlyD
MRIQPTIYSIVLFCCLILTAPFASADLVVEQGKRVSIDYVLYINSQQVESTEGKEPLSFVIGSKSVLPGLENQLMGMTVGQAKKVIVDAKDAYGPVDPNAFKEVPKTAMPEGTELKPGVVVEAEDPQGGSFPGVIWEVKTDSVVLNFNHPLAGQTLEFDVKVLDIQ